MGGEHALVMRITNEEHDVCLFIQSLVIRYRPNIQVALLFSVLHLWNTEKYTTSGIRTYSYVHLSETDRGE